MEEHDKRAEELERQAEKLEQRGDQVDDRIDQLAGDWERKKDDQQVPGAQRPDDDPKMRDSQEQTAEHGAQEGEAPDEEDDEGRSG